MSKKPSLALYALAWVVIFVAIFGWNVWSETARYGDFWMEVQSNLLSWNIWFLSVLPLPILAIIYSARKRAYERNYEGITSHLMRTALLAVLLFVAPFVLLAAYDIARLGFRDLSGVVLLVIMMIVGGVAGLSLVAAGITGARVKKKFNSHG